MKQDKKYIGRGGWRGGGRPKGIKTAKTENFSVRCTPEQKDKLKEFWQEIDIKN